MLRLSSHRRRSRCLFVPRISICEVQWGMGIPWETAHMGKGSVRGIRQRILSKQGTFSSLVMAYDGSAYSISWLFADYSNATRSQLIQNVWGPRGASLTLLACRHKNAWSWSLHTAHPHEGVAAVWNTAHISGRDDDMVPAESCTTVWINACSVRALDSGTMISLPRHTYLQRVQHLVIKYCREQRCFNNTLSKGTDGLQIDKSHPFLPLSCF